jgi:2-polyprenyl-3-methyl-5-hydroxy-6-metoxy-1,4-benzoquinol methylase
VPTQAQGRAIIEPYRWLAEYYDDLFGTFRSPIDSAREKILRRILPRIHSACDLACGTGSTALSLARRGLQVYGVDLSPTMCEAAQKKAAQQRLPIHVLQGDMRAFHLPRRIDLVTCEGDAVNHLSHHSDLQAVAASVACSLKPGGHFFFDVNNLKGFKRYWKGTVWLEKPGVVVVMRNGHDMAERKAWSDIEWFIQEGKLWSRNHEYVEEICWTPSEIRRALVSAGFESLKSFDAAPFYKDNAMVTPGCRTIYLARLGRQLN